MNAVRYHYRAVADDEPSNGEQGSLELDIRGFHLAVVSIKNMCSTT
jgi:hypothetical protein